MTSASSALDILEKWRAGRGMYSDGAEPYTSEGRGTDTVASAAVGDASVAAAVACEAGGKPGGVDVCYNQRAARSNDGSGVGWSQQMCVAEA